MKTGVAPVVQHTGMVFNLDTVAVLSILSVQAIALGVIILRGAPSGKRASLLKGALLFPLVPLIAQFLGSSTMLKSFNAGWTAYWTYSRFVSRFISKPSAYPLTTRVYYGQVVYDLEALAFVGVTALLTFLLFYPTGVRSALLRVMSILSLLVVFLSSDVGLFDYKEFFLHATSNFFLWVNNADLLVGGLGLLGVGLLLRRMGYYE